MKQSQVVSQTAPSNAAKAQAPQSQTGPPQGQAATPQGQAATPHYVALTGDPEKDKKIKNLSKVSLEFVLILYFGYLLLASSLRVDICCLLWCMLISNH